MNNFLKFLVIIITFLFLGCLTTEEEPKKPQETETVETQEPAEEPEVEVSDSEEYVATEEEYETTFSQIEELIIELNSIISKGDYTTWLNYLSEEYVNQYSDKEYLKKLSENPLFKEYNIKLKTLRDYFNYVVVPSRSNVKVDEIEFLSEDSINAYVFKDDEKFIVYRLVRSEDSWIISN